MAERTVTATGVGEITIMPSEMLTVMRPSQWLEVARRIRDVMTGPGQCGDVTIVVSNGKARFVKPAQSYDLREA